MTRRFPSAGPLVLSLLFLLAGCASRDGMVPTEPLTPTPDAAFRSAPPELDAEPLVRPPSLRSLTLDNGLRLVVVERPDFPSVELAFASRRARDQPTGEKGGLAVLTARALTLESDPSATDASLATEAGELDADADLLGKPDVRVTSSGTSFRLSADVGDFEQALTRLRASLRRPARFRDETVISVRRWLMLALERSRNSRVLERAAMRAFFGDDHPLLRRPIDAAAAWGDVSSSQLAAFYTERYGPSDSALVVVGAVTAEQVFESARREFGDWKDALSKKDVPEARRPPLPQGTRRVQAFTSLGKGGAVVVAAECVGLDDPDGLVLDLIAARLGSFSGSAFSAELRHDTGASYAWDASCAQRVSGGVFLVRADADAERFGDVLGTILAELDRLSATPLPAGELERAKVLLLADIAQDILTNSGLAHRLALLHLSNWPLNHFETIEARVRAITPEKARDTARRYLSRSRAGVAILGNPTFFSMQLERFGAWEPR